MNIDYSTLSFTCKKEQGVTSSMVSHQADSCQQFRWNDERCYDMKVYIYLNNWQIDYETFGTDIVWVSDQLHPPYSRSEINVCDQVEFWEDGIKQWSKYHDGPLSPNWI